MRIASLALAAVVCASQALAAPATPKFVEETAAAGIDHVFQGGWEYMVGGGVATFDCDDDGFPDMLMAGGEAKAAFFRNASTEGGALKFERQESGLELEAVSGAYPLDIDGDGITDIALIRVGEALVMRGKGGCRFERANEAWGFVGRDLWSAAFAATWERGANWPTLAVGTYIDRTQEAFPWGNCSDNQLYRPDGDARRFAPPLALKPSFCTLSMLFTDWNRSGQPALRVSNDREYYKGGQEQMWHVEAGQPPRLYTAAEGWARLRIWGMGIASTDLDGDGFPDYFLTSMADNKMQVLAPAGPDGKRPPVYRDIAFARGMTAHRPYTGGEVKPSTAWHAQFEDVNNDGLADLFVAKGNVWEMPDFAMKDPNNLLVQQPDGKFVETGEIAGVASMETARGAALTDFNLDGLVDIVVVNRHQKAQLWRNVTPGAGRWVGVELAQDGANRDGIGAWIEVKTGERVQRREITLGGGHAGGQLGWWHFGLGDVDAAEVRVLWPDGEQGGWQSVRAGANYGLARGKEPARWVP